MQFCSQTRQATDIGLQVPTVSACKAAAGGRRARHVARDMQSNVHVLKSTSGGCVAYRNG